MKNLDKVILAYSGGLDTSIIIPWLMDNYDVEVIACAIDVGQNEDLEEVEKKAYESGAKKVYVIDGVYDFVKNYVFESIKANALYEGIYPLGTALARPLMGKALVEIAHKENAKYIAHGCTGKGNDQVRFETSIYAFDPTIKIIAPWRLWDIKSREEEIDYANEKGIEVSSTKEKIYSIDQNIMHISHEGGELEDFQNEADLEKILMYSKSVYSAQDEIEKIEIEFEKGEAVKINGKKLEADKLLQEANEIAGRNGIGTIDIVENRLVGMKSRGVYETPGATLLIKAHQFLESVTIDKDTLNLKNTLSLNYANLIYDGKWFSTARKSLASFFDKTQENVSGKVKLNLYKGNIIPTSIQSENALFDYGISSFGESDLYDHKDAYGFIRLFSLPTRIESMKNIKAKK